MTYTYVDMSFSESVGLVYVVIKKSVSVPKHLSVPICSAKVPANQRRHGRNDQVQIVGRSDGPSDAKKIHLDTENNAPAPAPAPEPAPMPAPEPAPMPAPEPAPPPIAASDSFPESSNSDAASGVSSLHVNSAAQQSSGAERNAEPAAESVDAISDVSPQDDASHGGLTRPFNIPHETDGSRQSLIAKVAAAQVCSICHEQLKRIKLFISARNSKN